MLWSIVQLLLYVVGATVALVCSFIAYSYYLLEQEKKRLDHIPTLAFPDAPNYLAGWARMLRGDVQQLSMQLDMCNKFMPHGGIFKIRGGIMFPYYLVVICHPTLSKKALREPRKGRFYHMLNKFAKKGTVFSADGAFWTDQRHHLNPAFSVSAVKRTREGIMKVANEMLDTLDSENGGEVDVDNLLGRAALDVIGESIFGRSAGAIAGESELARNVANSFRNFKRRASRGPITMLLFEAAAYFKAPWLNADYRELAEIRKANLGYCAKIVEERLKDPKKHQKKDILTLILEGRETYQEKHAAGDDGDMESIDDDDEVSNSEIDMKMGLEQTCLEMVTLLAAGHETTAHSMAFTLYHLAEHPEYQEKIVQEIQDIKKRTGWDRIEDFTYEEFNQAPFINACIKEALRMYPVAANLNIRQLTKDQTFHAPDEGVPDEIFVPKDTCVWVPSFALHRHNGLWEKPNEYDPTRFLDKDKNGNVILKRFGSFVPFSFGPRNCLGMGLAETEMRAFVALLVDNFEWYTTPGAKTDDGRFLKMTIELTLKPLGGLNLRYARRKRAQ